jgi:rod shape-determining protein MreC
MVETRGGRRFAVLFLVGAFLVLILGRWITPVNHVAMSVTAPFAAVINGTANAVGDSVGGILNAGQIQGENRALRKQNAMLVQRIIQLQSQAHDNSLLRNMVRFEAANSHMDYLPARVIYSDPTGLGAYVVIDKGTRDGLREGMTVLDQNGYFVGSITDLTVNAARVLLMLSPSSSVAAMDMDVKSGATGLIEGRYAARPELKYVLTGSKLHVNDLLVTQGQANLYPRNLLMGQIIRVHKSPQNVFQTADVRPAADFSRLEIVQVIRNWIPHYPARLITPH